MDRQRWLAKRRGGLGATDSAVVYLRNVYGRTLVDVLLSKLGKDEEEEQTSPDMDRGNYCERVALEKWKRDLGIEVDMAANDADKYDRFWINHPSVPYLFANVDARTSQGDPVEVKCPRVHGYRDVKENGLRDHYLVQGQHQLGCMPDAEATHFLIFSAELWEYQYIRVPRDEELIQLIFERDAKFWNDHVVQGLPIVEESEPAPVVKRVGGEIADMSSSEAWAQVAQVFGEALRKEKEAKREREEAKKLICELMDAQAAAAIRVGESKFYYRDREGKTSLDRKLMKLHGIDLSKYEKKGKSYKDFRAYVAGVTEEEENE